MKSISRGTIKNVGIRCYIYLSCYIPDNNPLNIGQTHSLILRAVPFKKVGRMDLTFFLAPHPHFSIIFYPLTPTFLWTADQFDKSPQL